MTNVSGLIQALAKIRIILRRGLRLGGLDGEVKVSGAEACEWLETLRTIDRKLQVLRKYEQAYGDHLEAIVAYEEDGKLDEERAGGGS